MDRVNFKKDRIPFTQVANSVLNDPKLSAKAKGLYAYLYSKPDGWNFAIDRIQKEFTDGRLSINNGLKELEDNGYLYRQRQKTGRVVYLLKSQMSKIDMGEEKPNVENRKVRKPQSAKTVTVSNTDTKVIKSNSNTDGEETSQGLSKTISKKQIGVIAQLCKNTKISTLKTANGWYSNKTQRKALDEMVGEFGFAEVYKRFSMLPKFNKRGFKQINTPKQLQDNWYALDNTITNEKKMYVAE